MTPERRRAPVGRVSTPASDLVVSQSKASAAEPADHESTGTAYVRETVHDLRSPLTAIQESVRLVHDGDAGSINGEQRECLSVALQQCDSIRQQIDCLLDRTGSITGSMLVHRMWTEIADIRRRTDDVLRHSLPAGVTLRWRIDETIRQPVFGDAALLTRMMTNLVQNAAKVSPVGSTVAVTVDRDPVSESIQWTVRDEGPGLSADELNRIVERDISLTGGHGLGLTICRQIASLHFSSLQIESTPGRGTAIGFKTPAAGPPSIAERWCAWRLSQSLEASEPAARATDQPDPSAIMRVDGPQSLSDPATVRVNLAATTHHPNSPDQVVAGTVALGAACPIGAADGFDRFLQQQMTPCDLVYRIQDRRWVWMFDTGISDMRERLRAMDASARSCVPGARLTWSDPQVIGIQDRRFVSRVSDMLVRKSLTAQLQQRSVDRMARPQSSPIDEPSAIATERLERELSRLRWRLHRQHGSLMRHRSLMRPIDGMDTH